ncbi:MAG: TRAP transporter large permease subunit [Alphaproteobacteria bacterium]|nr:TRAP transporter large permease subunit [Alphaproteobacteria bacterium]MDE0407388.1 TRAP transporter large permease subunit [Alphaproteobacteria bacterium]
MTLGIGLMMFPALMVAIFMGFPVAWSLMGIALIFGYYRFGDALVYQLVAKVDDVASYYVLAAVPLFVFMGVMLERSGIAERLFEAIHLWTRRLPGGLAVGTVLLCVVFAAASGVVGATESVVGLLAIPIMLRYAYNKGLISGTICAGGSLGTIIPPSVVVVILGPVADVSVGDLFVGMLFPGLLLALSYVLYILVRCMLKPEDGPRLPPSDDDPPLAQRIYITATAMMPPLVLIFSVLGTIMLGWATPTEAAAMGAIGTVILTVVYGRFNVATLHAAFMKTLQVTAMILTILLGGTMFAGVFVALGGISAVEGLLAAANLSATATIFILLFIAFIAGFVLDLISIVLIIIPVAVAVLRKMGVDDVWFCIMFLIVIQTSYLTPPMAPAIFYLRGISPPEIKLADMYRGVIPFIVLELVVLALVYWFPGLALWLPSVVFKTF